MKNGGGDGIAEIGLTGSPNVCLEVRWGQRACCEGAEAPDKYLRLGGGVWAAPADRHHLLFPARLRKEHLPSGHVMCSI